MTDKPDMTPVFCRDECGTNIPRCELEGSGWEYLQIQTRYRCVNCCTK